MKTRLDKKLTLKRETICGLTDTELRNVAGAKTCGDKCLNQSIAPACDISVCNGTCATCNTCGGFTCGPTFDSCFSCQSCFTCRYLDGVCIIIA
jgi:hypothetical protein